MSSQARMMPSASGPMLRVTTTLYLDMACRLRQVGGRQGLDAAGRHRDLTTRPAAPAETARRSDIQIPSRDVEATPLGCDPRFRRVSVAAKCISHEKLERVLQSHHLTCKLHTIISQMVASEALRAPRVLVSTSPRTAGCGLNCRSLRPRRLLAQRLSCRNCFVALSFHPLTR